MKRRSRRNNNKASRVGPASLRYIDIVSDRISTTASTYKTQYPYQIKQLLPSLQNTSKKRLVRFRRFELSFSPLESATPATENIPVSIQLEAIDPVTGNPVPCTRVMNLSETNPRSISFTIGTEFERWFYQDDPFKPLIISVYNMQSAAPVSNFTVVIRSEVDAQMSEPTPV
jgi:hypothetical protein